MEDEQTITIDETEFKLSELSEDAKAHIAGVRLCEQKTQQLKQELAIVQTARAGYASALKAALPTATVTADSADDAKADTSA